MTDPKARKPRVNVRDIAFPIRGGDYVTTDGKTMRRTNPNPPTVAAPTATAVADKAKTAK